MSVKRFYDTNILVYAYDTDEGDKQRLCAGLIKEVFARSSVGAISNQILGELFYTLTEKVNPAISRNTALKILGGYVKSDGWIKVDYDSSTVLKACASVEAFGSSFWDTVIAETMKENGIAEILTENTKDFEKIPGIKVTNPFRS